MGAHAADHLGRARLRRARRQLVPARRTSRLHRWPTAAPSAGKRRSPVPARARELADETGEAVRVLWRREDVVRRGPKRPPLAIALRPDGTGILRVGVAPQGSADLGAVGGAGARAVPGRARRAGRGGRAAGGARPARGRLGRGAGRPQCARGSAAAAGHGPGPRRAARRRGAPASSVHLGDGERGRVEVDVWAGEVLCRVTLRSYALGAVHQALGMVWSEGIAVDAAGEPVDLTIRSFGILAARDMPEVVVRLHEEERWPVNGSDAVFVATLAAAWIADGLPARWPTRRAAVRCAVAATWHHRAVELRGAP